MKIRNKILFAAVAVFLLAAGCNKSEPVRDPGTNDVNLEQASGQSAEPTNQIVSSTPKTQSPVKEKQIEAKSVENAINYNGQEGKTALELLKAKYTVETKSFGSAGEFVESINGVKPDSKHFWKFFINGKSASVGAGSYVTKRADILEWKLDAIQ